MISGILGVPYWVLILKNPTIWGSILGELDRATSTSHAGTPVVCAAHFTAAGPKAGPRESLKQPDFVTACIAEPALYTDILTVSQREMQEEVCLGCTGCRGREER